MKQPLYTVSPRGNLWRLLRWEYVGNGSRSEIIGVYMDKASAYKAFAEIINQ